MDRINKLEEYLSGKPGDSFLQHALALEHIKQGDDVKARSLFENILKNEPGYIGSYYHFAKLLERNGETVKAISVYKDGMEEARKAGDEHAYGELRSAYEEMMF